MEWGDLILVIRVKGPFHPFSVTLQLWIFGDLSKYIWHDHGKFDKLMAYALEYVSWGGDFHIDFGHRIIRSFHPIWLEPCLLEVIMDELMLSIGLSSLEIYTHFGDQVIKLLL